MIEKYEQLPEWLRWILLLPLSAVFTVGMILLLSLLRDDFRIIHSLAAIVTLMIALYMLAPRWKKGLVLTSLILRMTISIAVMSFILAHGATMDRQLWFETGREVLGWIVGWSLYFSVIRTHQ